MLTGLSKIKHMASGSGMGQLNKDALLEISQDPRQYGFAVTFPIYVAEATRVSAREPLTAAALANLRKSHQLEVI